MSLSSVTQSSNRSPTFSSSYGIPVQRIIDNSKDHLKKNAVQVSPQLFNALFPDKDNDTPHYVKINNWIYPVEINPHLSGNLITINAFQREERNESICRGGCELIVYRIDEALEAIPAFEEIWIELAPYESLPRRGLLDDPLWINVEELKEEFLRHYNTHYLMQSQQIYLENPRFGSLELKMISSKFSADETQPTNVSRGKITEKTELNFSVQYFIQNIHIFQEYPPEWIKRLCFEVKEVINMKKKVSVDISSNTINKEWPISGTHLPLHVSLEEIQLLIRQLCQEKLIYYQTKITLNLGGGGDWEYTLGLSSVELKGKYPKKFKYHKAVKLDPSHEIQLKANEHLVFTKGEKDRIVAEQATIEINDFESFVNGENVVDVSSLEKQIKEEGRLIVEKGLFNLTLETGQKLLLKVVSVWTTQTLKEGVLKNLWQIDSTTRVLFKVKSGIDLTLVDSPLIYLARKVVVKVYQTTDTIKYDDKFFRQLFFGLVPKQFVEKKEVGTITGNNTIGFTVDKVEVAAETQPTGFYGALYEYNEQTIFEFNVIPNGPSSITNFESPLSYSYEDFKKFLSMQRIGGLSEQTQKIYNEIILPRQQYSAWGQANGQKANKGFLLAGPPGTGKTRLIEALGTLLGCTGDRLKFVVGASIWNKYIGESEKRVRALFESARIAQRDLGLKSPLFLIAIDECENVFSKRQDSDANWKSGVTTTFLSEIDGIDSLNNVIVIGITNKPDMIDEAVIRPGRLSPTITMGNPNKEGIKEIFNIHMREMKDNGIIDESIDIDQLAEMALGHSGAFIEGIVRLAFSYSLARLNEAGIPPEDIKGHPLSKLTMPDFEKAYHSLANSRKRKVTVLSPSKQPPLTTRTYLAEQHGLVGFSEETIQEIDRTILSSNIHRQQLKKLNLPMQKGLLIHGTAGSGKTSLAKAFESLLYCPSDHFHYYSKDPRLDKNPVGSWNEIKNILDGFWGKSADLEDDAPPFVLVIEEIDQFFTEQTMPYDPSTIIDAFVKSAEGLYLGADNPLENLFIIGTLSHKGYIGENDPLRQKKEGTLYLSLSTSEQRRGVLESALKELLQEGCVLDVEEILCYTEGKSCNEIKTLCRRAFTLSLQDPEQQLKNEHFERAWRESQTPQLSYMT